VSYSSDVQQTVEQALSRAGEVCTAWVLVYESVEEDGTVCLHHEVSPELPNWTRTGMLYAALDMGTALYEDEE
jgi:hypothetical protein